MSDKVLNQAHRLYDLEGDYVRRLIEKDPNYAELATAMVLFKSRVGAHLGSEQAERMQKAMDLLLTITREHAFKLGYLMADAQDRDEAAPV